MKYKLIVLLLLVSIAGIAQTGKIIALAGTPKRASSGALLRQGDKLQDKELVKWGSENDTLVINVLGKGLGYYTPAIDPRTSNGGSSEWQALIREMVWLKKSSGRLAGRGIRFNSIVEMDHFFSQFAADSVSLLVIDSLPLTISKEMYSSINRGFLYAQYFVGADTVNKKIRVITGNEGKNPVIMLDTSLQRVDGIPRDLLRRKHISIYYFNYKDETSSLVTDFYVSVITSSPMMATLCALNSGEENTYEQTDQLLRWKYGIPDEKQLRNLLENLDCK